MYIVSTVISDKLINSLSLLEKDNSLKSRVAIYGISLYVIGLVGFILMIFLQHFLNDNRFLDYI